MAAINHSWGGGPTWGDRSSPGTPGPSTPNHLTTGHLPCHSQASLWPGRCSSEEQAPGSAAPNFSLSVLSMCWCLEGKLRVVNVNISWIIFPPPVTGPSPSRVTRETSLFLSHHRRPQALSNEPEEHKLISPHPLCKWPGQDTQSADHAQPSVH